MCQGEQNHICQHGAPQIHPVMSAYRHIYSNMDHILQVAQQLPSLHQVCHRRILQGPVTFHWISREVLRENAI